MLLFVYGSLRRGQRSHGELRNARFVSEVRTEPRYELVDVGSYPALIEGGSCAVAGELYEVDAGVLAALDDFEDVPNEYLRVRVAIAGRETETIEGYVMSAERGAALARIASGDYCKR